ncbi:hypothetical protein [Photorhabdus sp. SF281]|uniref:hypothetical protein n=1 Tax=Photorhabdus sp. SF281 TaxID=3459527 RepID=UPI0040439A20
MLSDCAGSGGLCTLTYQAEMEGGIKTADAISGLRWMFGLSAEDAQRLSQFVTTENQNDLGLLYNSLPAWEKGALIAKEAVESAGIGGKVSVASIIKGNKSTTNIGKGNNVRINNESSVRSNNQVTIPESRVGHIFRKSEGHIADTSENRKLILDVANDKTAILGSDRYGNNWSARMLPDGTQAWVQTRGDTVINAGINNPPKSYDPQAGLSSLKPRGSKNGK